MVVLMNSNSFARRSANPVVLKLGHSLHFHINHSPLSKSTSLSKSTQSPRRPSCNNILHSIIFSNVTLRFYNLALHNINIVGTRVQSLKKVVDSCKTWMNIIVNIILPSLPAFIFELMVFPIVLMLRPDIDMHYLMHTVQVHQTIFQLHERVFCCLGK